MSQDCRSRIWTGLSKPREAELPLQLGEGRTFAVPLVLSDCHLGQLHVHGPMYVLENQCKKWTFILDSINLLSSSLGELVAVLRGKNSCSDEWNWEALISNGAKLAGLLLQAHSPAACMCTAAGKGKQSLWREFTSKTHRRKRWRGLVLCHNL